jgi:TP901 family phage tail tape measure protein
MAITVADLLVRFRADTKDAERGIDNVNRQLGLFSGAAHGIGRSVVGLGVAMAGAGIAASAAVGGMAVAGVKASMDLEQSVADIAAVMGKTVNEVAPLKQLITDLAIDPKLKVSASEAAAAIEMLARNGMKMDDILAGGARAVVALSNATGGDMARAADLATDALAQFGLKASDLTTVIDRVAGVTVSSKLTMEDFQFALAQAGGVAGSAGVSFDDFATAIAGIAPLFASGSDAGTSFKTFLQRLGGASKEATNVMRELGIITADGSNRFFDAAGNMRSMSEIAGVLQEALAGLSDQQRTAALTTIFGADAIRTATALAKLGSEGFNDLAKSVQGMSAFEAAATRVSTTSGALEILSSVIESLQLSFQPLLPLVRDVALALADWAAQLQGPLTALVSSLAERIRDSARAAGSFFEAAAQMGAQLAGLVAPATRAITSFVSLKDILITFAIAVAPLVVAALASIITAAAPLVLTFAALAGGVALLRNAWEGNWGGIQEKTQQVIAVLTERFVAISAALSQMTTSLSGGGNIVTVFSNSLSRLGNAVLGAGEQLVLLAPSAQSVIDAFGDLADAVAPLIALLGVTLGAAALLGVNLLTSVFENLPALLIPIVDQVAATIRTIADVVREVTALVSAVIRGDWAAAWRSASNIVQTFAIFVSGTFERVKSFLAAVFSTIKQTIVTTLNDLNVDAGAYLAAFLALFEETFASAQASVNNAISAMMSTLRSLVTYLTTTLQDAFNRLKDFLASLSLPNPFAALSGAVSSIQSAIDGLKSKIDELAQWLSTVKIPNPFSGFSLPSLPGFASGTVHARGGLALVGEQGPELVVLPRGAQVLPAQRTAEALRGSTTVNVYATLNSEIDVERLALRIARIIDAQGAFA